MDYRKVFAFIVVFLQSAARILEEKKNEGVQQWPNSCCHSEFNQLSAPALLCHRSRTASSSLNVPNTNAW